MAIIADVGATDERPEATVRHFDRDQVRTGLDPVRLAPLLRTAMIDLSTVATEQPLRQIVPVAPQKLFALMPGMLPAAGLVGAKVITVYPAASDPARSAHRGVVLGFDRDTGALVGTADAGEVTSIRTAVASAVATDALARGDARSLAVLGSGEQAHAHARIIATLRPLDRIDLWGRTPASVERLAATLRATIEVPITVHVSPEDAVRHADIVCTVTSALTPILRAGWIRPGSHVNAVGSSFDGPCEIDSALVAASRYVVDCRRHALVAASEFLAAKRAGLIDDTHILGEIGDVLAGRVAGRIGAADVTLYKSLGHIVQDLAALRCLLSDPVNPSSTSP